MSAPHDTPTAEDLVTVVRDWLRDAVLPAVEGRLQFHTRVAINVLSIVARELELGPEQAKAHAERLNRCGVSSEQELADRIRGGSLSMSSDVVWDAVFETVRDKLKVANPKYLEVAERSMSS